MLPDLTIFVWPGLEDLEINKFYIKNKTVNFNFGLGNYKYSVKYHHEVKTTHVNAI